MQTELLNRQRWRTRVEVANAMLGCIEGFHDRRRRHSALGWASPHKTETAPQLLKVTPVNRGMITFLESRPAPSSTTPAAPGPVTRRARKPR